MQAVPAAFARFALACLGLVPATASPDVTELLELVAAGLTPRAAVVADALVEGGPREVARWLREAPAAAELAPGALDELHRATLTALLERRAVGSDPEDALDNSELRDLAHAGLTLAEAVGEAADLPRVLALGRIPEQADGVRWRGVRREQEAALRSILARDPCALDAAARLYGGLGWPEALSLARAIAGVEGRATLELLAGLLGVHPPNDGGVLGEIGSAAERTGASLSAGSLQRIRFYLDSTEAYDRRQAAYALGRLDDFESVEPLLDLLTDEDGGVRRVSHWALQRITRMSMAQDAPRWRAWFEEERQWWAVRGQTILGTLRSGETAAELVPVINEAATKRLFRRLLSPELRPLLSHPDPAVVRMACGALLSLRARESAPALVELLDAPEPDVRALAWKVLRELTGYELPADAGAWREELATDPVPR